MEEIDCDISRIMCNIHNEKFITYVDLKLQTSFPSRVLCTYCVQNEQFDGLSSIQKIPSRIKEFSEKKCLDIQEIYQKHQDKLKKVLKGLNTLKDQIIKVMDHSIKTTQTLLDQLNNTITEEIGYYKNLQQDFTRTKLHEIGELLSGSKKKDSFLSQMKGKLIYMEQTIVQNFKQVISYQRDYSEVIKQTIEQTCTMLFQTTVEKPCISLVCNLQTQQIFGLLGNDILIWKQTDQQLIQTNILRNCGDALRLAVCKAGDKFILGGNQSLSLYGLTDNKWQRFGRFTCAAIIIDVKISEDDNELIALGAPVQIWKIDHEKNKLTQTQKISASSSFISPYTSFSNDQKYLAISSIKNYFHIYTRANVQEAWLLQSKVETEGEIHQIHYIDNNQIICHQESPPKFLIFQLYNQNQFQLCQELILNSQIGKKGPYPILQISNTIYCSNGKCVYVIKRQISGKWSIDGNLEGQYPGACVDVTGKFIILGNSKNNTIEIYSS